MKTTDDVLFGREPTRPEPRTITARAAVAVDPKTGEWGIVGWSGAEGADDFDVEAREYGGQLGDDAQITYITAEIPIREVPEIVAEVEK